MSGWEPVGAWSVFSAARVTMDDGHGHADEVRFAVLGQFSVMYADGPVRMNAASMRELAALLSEGADALEARSPETVVAALDEGEPT